MIIEILAVEISFDKDKNNILKRPNICHIFKKQGVQGYQPPSRAKLNWVKCVNQYIFVTSKRICTHLSYIDLI